MYIIYTVRIYYSDVAVMEVMAHRLHMQYNHPVLFFLWSSKTFKLTCYTIYDEFGVLTFIENDAFLAFVILFLGFVRFQWNASKPSMLSSFALRR